MAPDSYDAGAADGTATTKNVHTKSLSTSSLSALSCASDGSDSSENLDQKRTTTLTLYVLLFVLSASVVLMRELSCIIDVRRQAINKQKSDLVFFLLPFFSLFFSFFSSSPSPSFSGECGEQ